MRTFPVLATRRCSVAGEAITTLVPTVLYVRDAWVRSPPQTLPEKRIELPMIFMRRLSVLSLTMLSAFSSPAATRLLGLCIANYAS